MAVPIASAGLCCSDIFTHLHTFVPCKRSQPQHAATAAWIGALTAMYSSNLSCKHSAHETSNTCCARGDLRKFTCSFVTITVQGTFWASLLGASKTKIDDGAACAEVRTLACAEPCCSIT